MQPAQEHETQIASPTPKSLAGSAMRIFWAVLLCISIIAPVPALAVSADWAKFLKRHVHAEGRVIDGGAGGISHSEGQGFGMLLAVHFEDRETFDRMYKWTRKNLMIRDDGLLAWRWVPQLEVTDRNNATDGDILVAWALMRAGARWKSSDYRDSGVTLARTVREKLIRRTPRGIVLLPGMEGFEQNDSIVLNPSYWVFPAFAEFRRTEQSPVWTELIETGYRMLADARFGRWGLPPDWLRQTGTLLALPDDRPPRYGYDAIRIPLYLLWNNAAADAMLPFRAFSAHFVGASFFPAWTNLKDDSVDSHDAIKGMRAIGALTTANPSLRNIVLPEMDESQPYYSDVLLLLAKMMLWERTER